MFDLIHVPAIVAMLVVFAFGYVLSLALREKKTVPAVLEGAVSAVETKAYALDASVLAKLTELEAQAKVDAGTLKRYVARALGEVETAGKAVV